MVILNDGIKYFVHKQRPEGIVLHSSAPDKFYYKHLLDHQDLTWEVGVSNCSRIVLSTVKTLLLKTKRRREC
jgi:hypothetical protein